VLFEPGLAYHIETQVTSPSSTAFLRLLAGVTGSAVEHARTVEVLTNGEAFYEAELAAIRAARRSVHIVAFIFHPGEIGDRFLAALTERAQAGVIVRVLVDAIGSFPTPDRYFATLRAAGGIVAWYQPVRWYTLKRFNNRTHREIIVVDAETGFVGGAGIASHWFAGNLRQPPWRDTMLRVTGGIVSGLQTAFAENWLEATGEILMDPQLFPAIRFPAEGVAGFVAIGTPSPARSSPARVLFQALLAAARETIDVNSPYFLPDRSARREMIAAVRRGVRVRVITPGRFNNHPIARLASRRRYGELLKAGVEIHEFQPGMIHAKIFVMDGLWSVVGSTNFDSRSFDLNDEVNLAVMDPAVAARLNVDFERDRALSERVTLVDWDKRGLGEKVLAMLGRILERQE
jgi:cardiolipin synthase A/B